MLARKIDPTVGDAYILTGRVVTMNSRFEVITKGAVYVRNGIIVAIQRKDLPRPQGFEVANSVDTGGTIYPGLIDLHNHLSYDILPMWRVPRLYTNRGQWQGSTDYRKFITGPMQVLGEDPGFLPAIVRYVECKCLLGGVTTSQGISLASNAGIQPYYKGLIRNVEQPLPKKHLPKASTHIADVAARDWTTFKRVLDGCSCMLLHLSEGVDESAHNHFLALKRDRRWAISSALAGIHSIALTPADYEIMHAHGASIVWSPLSNLMLYGKTANIAAAKSHGLTIGIGADWSASGSRSLFNELKICWIYSGNLPVNPFSDREIVAMATTNAAKILEWDRHLGSIEAGKYADLLVLTSTSGDPYQGLLTASETDIALVLIDGIPRYGKSTLMRKYTIAEERFSVGGAVRLLNLSQTDADKRVAQWTLAEAREKLENGLAKLPELAKRTRSGRGTGIRLLLDHEEFPNRSARHHLPFGPSRTPTAVTPLTRAAAIPLSNLLEPLTLDPLTIADDGEYFKDLGQQPNLPEYVSTELRKLM